SERVSELVSVANTESATKLEVSVCRTATRSGVAADTCSAAVWIEQQKRGNVVTGVFHGREQEGVGTSPLSRKYQFGRVGPGVKVHSWRRYSHTANFHALSLHLLG